MSILGGGEPWAVGGKACASECWTGWIRVRGPHGGVPLTDGDGAGEVGVVVEPHKPRVGDGAGAGRRGGS